MFHLKLREGNHNKRILWLYIIFIINLLSTFVNFIQNSVHSKVVVVLFFSQFIKLFNQPKQLMICVLHIQQKHRNNGGYMKIAIIK